MHYFRLRDLFLHINYSNFMEHFHVFGVKNLVDGNMSINIILFMVLWLDVISHLPSTLAFFQ